MAVRSLLVTPGFRGEITRVRWTGLLTGDTGEPLSMAQFFDRSIQVVGTFGPGGTLIIEGSNDGGGTYSTLTDVIGNNLSLTSSALRQVSELPEYLRPRVTGGDGTTDLDVYMFLRGRH